MFTRELVSQLLDRMNEPRRFIQILSGARQTGKTTAMLQAIKKLKIKNHYVSADDPTLVSIEWLRNEWQQARVIAESEECILIIDEVQKVSNWSAVVKQLWDEDTRFNVNLKVFLTGSSSMLLQKGSTESLMGRFEILYSLHWNYAECKKAFGYSLDDFLFYGGYPGAVPYFDDEHRWERYMSTTIVEPTVSQDVTLMEEIRKPALFVHFLCSDQCTAHKNFHIQRFSVNFKTQAIQ